MYQEFACLNVYFRYITLSSVYRIDWKCLKAVERIFKTLSELFSQDMMEALGYSLRRVRVPAQSLQLFLTLCNPVHHSPPGSSVHGIFQARILEWVALPSSRGSSWLRDQAHKLLHWQTHSLPLAPPGKPREGEGRIEKYLKDEFGNIWQYHMRNEWSGRIKDKSLNSCLSYCLVSSIIIEIENSGEVSWRKGSYIQYKMPWVCCVYQKYK